jgi:hypothetical protein
MSVRNLKHQQYFRPMTRYKVRNENERGGHTQTQIFNEIHDGWKNVRKFHVLP